MKYRDFDKHFAFKATVTISYEWDKRWKGHLLFFNIKQWFIESGHFGKWNYDCTGRLRQIDGDFTYHFWFIDEAVHDKFLEIYNNPLLRKLTWG